MSFLICRFASSRSTPERIHRWIDYLHAARLKAEGHPDRTQLIDHLLSQATGWLRAS